MVVKVVIDGWEVTVVVSHYIPEVAVSMKGHPDNWCEGEPESIEYEVKDVTEIGHHNTYLTVESREPNDELEGLVLREVKAMLS